MMLNAADKEGGKRGRSFTHFALTSALTGNRLWDALGSITVGVLLMLMAIFITCEINAMSVGESDDPEAHAAI